MRARMTPPCPILDLSEYPERFGAAYDIYETSLPAAERKSRGDIEALLTRDDYALSVAISDTAVVAISIVYVDRTHRFGLLEYMATRPDCRNMGLGLALFEHALATCRNRTLLIEVESVSGAPRERATQHRRQAWYTRLGCHRLTGLNYCMPQLQNLPPPPLDLMYHPNGRQTPPQEADLRAWISNIYSNVYGLNDNRDIVEAMFSSLKSD